MNEIIELKKGEFPLRETPLNINRVAKNSKFQGNFRNNTKK